MLFSTTPLFVGLGPRPAVPATDHQPNGQDDLTHWKDLEMDSSKKVKQVHSKIFTCSTLYIYRPKTKNQTSSALSSCKF